MDRAEKTTAYMRTRCDIVVHSGSLIYPGVQIGSGSKIQAGCLIFEGVTIEEDVFIGPGVIFTNVKRPRAFIKSGGFEKTLVEKGATIGAGSIIMCGIRIGKYAFIGAGSLVTKSVYPNWVVYGRPAAFKGLITKDGMAFTEPEGFMEIVRWGELKTKTMNWECLDNE